MPSFDIVSECDKHEVTNAVDQANREVGTRFDFKDTGAQYEYQGDKITLRAQAEFQLKQMMEVLSSKLTKRNVDLAHLQSETPVIQNKTATQVVALQEGIATEVAKKIIQSIKNEKKLKVQAIIQGEQIRVSGKKRDDLQEVMAYIRKTDFKIPLQFKNFRD